MGFATASSIWACFTGAAKKLLDDFKIMTPDPAVNDPPAVPPSAAEAAPASKDTKKPV